MSCRVIIVIDIVMVRAVRQTGRVEARDLYSEFCVQRADKTSDHCHGGCQWYELFAKQGMDSILSSVHRELTCQVTTVIEGVTDTIPQVRFIDRIANVPVVRQRQVQRSSSLQR